MTNLLNEPDFTAAVADKLRTYDNIEISTPEPLVISIIYSADEPHLTLKLASLYDEYKVAPEKMDVTVQPLLTEVGWTVKGTRYTFQDISEHTLPLIRDIKKKPYTPQETAGIGASKGPLVYQELVNRPEETVVVQLVMAKNELVVPLYAGDMLRSFPEPAQLASTAVQNLRRHVLEIGLTLSEYKIENFEATPWLVGFRGGRFRQFLASLIAVPEVMSTLEKTLNAQNGLVAIMPARDQLLVSVNIEEQAIAEIGLLAKYLKDEADDPCSAFIWHFKDGVLQRVQTIDVTDKVVEESDLEPES